MGSKDHPELARYTQEQEWFQFLREHVKNSEVPEQQLAGKTLTFLLEMYDRIIQGVEEGKPFIATYFCSAPEICTAPAVASPSVASAPLKLTVPVDTLIPTPAAPPPSPVVTEPRVTAFPPPVVTAK